MYELRDFKQTGTRELIADDYVYQIKRLAHPRLHSPIFGLMSEYIVGLKDYAAEAARPAAKTSPPGRVSRSQPVRADGVTVVDRYTYRIKVKGKYPQFLYWLAMPFFAPVPAEVGPVLLAAGHGGGRTFTLDWYPVGHRALHADGEQPEPQMVLERNPNFPGEPYPARRRARRRSGRAARRRGQDACPSSTKVVFSLEKESHSLLEQVPAGLLRRVRHHARTTSTRRSRSCRDAASRLTPEMEQAGHPPADLGGTSDRLHRRSTCSTRWSAASPSARASCARRISIAIDQEESISIFANGRGIAGTGPDPAGHLRLPRRARPASTPTSTTGSDGEPQRKSDRVREEAAGRGRLSQTASTRRPASR